MKSSTLRAVVLTAGILVVAGNLPRLPWDQVARQWRASVTQAVAQWPTEVRLDAWVPASLGASPRAASGPLCATRFGQVRAPRAIETAMHVWQEAGPIAFAVGGSLAGLLLLSALVPLMRRLPRDPRELVFQMARRGEPMALISRHARMPQDAVRTLLAPGIGARRG